MRVQSLGLGRGFGMDREWRKSCTTSDAQYAGSVGKLGLGYRYTGGTFWDGGSPIMTVGGSHDEDVGGPPFWEICMNQEI